MKKSIITIATMVTALGAFALAPMASAAVTDRPDPGRVATGVAGAAGDAVTTTRTHSVKHRKALVKHYGHTHRHMLKGKAKNNLPGKAGGKSTDDVDGHRLQQ